MTSFFLTRFFQLVFKALGSVLKIAGPAIDHALFDVLAAVGAVVGTLLAVVFQLVGTVLFDLGAVLVPLLKDVVPFVLQLNLATIISLLGL